MRSQKDRYRFHIGGLKGLSWREGSKYQYIGRKTVKIGHDCDFNDFFVSLEGGENRG